MLAPTHLIIGITSAVTLSTYSGTELNLPTTLAVLLGSLAPDIDGDGAITKPSLFFQGLIPQGVSKWANHLFKPIAFFTRKLFGHRGVLHWPILGLAIILAAKYYNNLWWFWFGWGYLMHILGDFCTYQGVPILGPLKAKKHSLDLFRTGSLAEKLLSVILLIPLVRLGLPMLPESVEKTVHKIWEASDISSADKAH